jgi:hypothetical protein
MLNGQKRLPDVEKKLNTNNLKNGKWFKQFIIIPGYESFK